MEIEGVKNTTILYQCPHIVLNTNIWGQEFGASSSTWGTEQ